MSRRDLTAAQEMARNAGWTGAVFFGLGAVVLAVAAVDGIGGTGVILFGALGGMSAFAAIACALLAAQYS